MLRHRIHLDHQAVHFVDRVVAVLAPIIHRLDDFVGRLRPARVLAHRQAPLGELLVRLVLRLRGEPFARTDAVADHAQLALFHVFRVLLPQAARRRVARVSKGLATFLLAQLVELGEILGPDEHLAADLQKCRRLAREPVRDVLDHPRVGGDVFAGGAVATGGGTDKLAVFVDEVDGQPVDFQLGQIRARGFGQPLAHLVFVENVVQAHHALGVGDVRKRVVGGRGANFLRRRIRHGELRVRLLQRLEAPEQLVEFAVGDDRLPVVIEVPVAADLCGQLVPFAVQISGNFTHAHRV